MNTFCNMLEGGHGYQRMKAYLTLPLVSSAQTRRGESLDCADASCKFDNMVEVFWLRFYGMKVLSDFIQSMFVCLFTTFALQVHSDALRVFSITVWFNSITEHKLNFQYLCHRTLHLFFVDEKCDYSWLHFMLSMHACLQLLGNLQFFSIHHLHLTEFYSTLDHIILYYWLIHWKSSIKNIFNLSGQQSSRKNRHSDFDSCSYLLFISDYFMKTNENQDITILLKYFKEMSIKSTSRNL